MIPMRTMRACTRIFKVEALNRYFETPCTVYVGIDASAAIYSLPSSAPRRLFCGFSRRGVFLSASTRRHFTFFGEYKLEHTVWCLTPSQLVSFLLGSKAKTTLLSTL
jgi:hypothetical protein